METLKSQVITVNKLKMYNSGVPIVILLILTVRNEIKARIISASHLNIFSVKTKISGLNQVESIQTHFVDINKMKKFIHQILPNESRNFKMVHYA